MTKDGLFPEPYSRVLDRLADFNILEAEGTPAETALELGCRVLVRDMMGQGTPFVTIRVEGDDATIYPAEIRNILTRFNVDIESYRAAGTTR